jgi:hypothetical protein
MYQDLEKDQRWVQIATVQGAIRNCGDVDYPGLFIRLDDPSIFSFIRSTINATNLKSSDQTGISFKKHL